MAHKYVLEQNEYLKAGENLIAPNGYFRFAMQRDGNLVVYRGNDPKDLSSVLWASDTAYGDADYFLIMQTDGNLVLYSGTPDHKGTSLWASNTNGKSPAYFALQNDGNICVYPGAKPKLKNKALWASNKTDHLKSIEITELNYDVAKSTMSEPQAAAPSDEQIALNDSPVTQTPTITGSLTYSRTSGWEDSIETGIAVKSTLDVEIPFVADESVEVSASIKNTYKHNDSTTTTKSVGWSVPLVVPSKTKIKVVADLDIINITVPFTEKGTITFESGETVTGNFEGVYSGTGTYLLTTSYGKAIPLPPDLVKEKVAE